MRNSTIASLVSTRVLTPQMAVLWAAFWNFMAFLFFHLKVAGTMGTGIIDPGIVDNRVIAAALIGACAWDIITWYWGLPTSSSHALIGGMIGAALAKSVSVFQPTAEHAAWVELLLDPAKLPLGWAGIGKTLLFILLAPLIGFAIGWTIALAVMWTFRKAPPRRVDGIFRKGQLVSAAFYSLGHGGNDAQKTMGIIFVLLIATSREAGIAAPADVPTEVVMACYIAMGIGTLFGGWRIVKTMGQKIIKLRPVDGFSAEVGAAATLVMTVVGGIPVSTTQTITDSIVGVGSLKRASAVHWGVAGQVVWAWILTIPGAALVSATSWWLLRWM